MRNRLKSSAPAAGPPEAPHVLVVFGDVDLRALVREFCATLAPGCQVTDVASVTDAVLRVLTTHVDIVLVDAALAGDLLRSLIRHVHRTSPGALVSVFGIEADVPVPADERPPLQVLPWSRLEATLMELLQVRLPPFSDPRQ